MSKYLLRTTIYQYHSQIWAMKSKASRERRQVRLWRQKMDAAIRDTPHSEAATICPVQQTTGIVEKTAATQHFTVGDAERRKAVVWSLLDIVLHMKPIETSQHIGEHTTSPAEASSAMRRLETGTSFSEKAPFRPPGVARIGPTPAMKSMALVIRSQILTPAHGTIMLPGRDRLKPKTRQISAGEKVFGIVELGEAILCQVGMRRLFLSRRVSKTFRDLIDTSRDLTEAMFTTYETLAIAMPNILNPLLGGSSQRDCRQLLFFKDFHAYHQPAENEWSFLGDTYCIKLRIVLDDDADLRRLSIFVRQQLSGSWLDTLLTSQPAEVMYSFVPSGQRLSFHMENACSLSCAGACGTLRMVQDDERVAEED